MLLGASCFKIWSISPCLSEEFTMESPIYTYEVQFWKATLLLVLVLWSLQPAHTYLQDAVFYCPGNNVRLQSSDSTIIPLLGSWLHPFEVCLSQKLLCYGRFLFLYSPVAHKGWNQKKRAALGRCREHGENLHQRAREHRPKKASDKTAAPALCLLTQHCHVSTDSQRVSGYTAAILGSVASFSKWGGPNGHYRWLTFPPAGKERVETRSWEVGPLPQAAFVKKMDGGGSQCFSSVLFF